MSDTPTLAQAAEKAEMPVIAYLRATKDEMPVWDGDDCVCQDPVYPSDPDGSDADCISMPMVRLSDAESQLAEMRAEVERLREDARQREFTEEQCIDLFTAALYISTRGDGTSTLSSENAERIVELLCDLSGVDLDFSAGIDAALAADGKDGAR